MVCVGSSSGSRPPLVPLSTLSCFPILPWPPHRFLGRLLPPPAPRRSARAPRGPQMWTPFWTPSFGPGTHTHSGPPNRVNKRSFDVTKKTICTVEYQSRAHQQHQFCHHAWPVCSCSEKSRRTLQVPLSKSCSQNVLGLPTNFDVTVPRSGCSPSET